MFVKDTNSGQAETIESSSYLELGLILDLSHSFELKQ